MEVAESECGIRLLFEFRGIDLGRIWSGRDEQFGLRSGMI